MDVSPDARKSLPQLREEWAACVKCDLGHLRLRRTGQLVFGEGAPRSIMLIAEGPGVDEEESGRPFVGASGNLLRRILKFIGLNEFYITNIVCCRSCEELVSADGKPMVARRGKNLVTRAKDEPPTPAHKAACRPRLVEEIYLVDPVVIVGLGQAACESLLKRPVAITRERGDTSQIAIPGASYRPILTEKKQQWMRKVGGNYIAPVEQNEVHYHFIPTLHPAHVLREIADKSPDSPFRKLVADLRKAKTTYDTYMGEAFGVLPSERASVDVDELHQQFEETYE